MISPNPYVAMVSRTNDEGPTRYGKVKLDRNERTEHFPSSIIENIRARISSETLSVYPEPWPLYERFAEFLGQPKERLLFNSGSDLSIKSIFETYLSPRDRVLLHRPGYAMFSVYSRLFGCKPEYLDADRDLAFDYTEYLAMIDSSMRMAVLENPNGFTGIAPPRRVLQEFIETCEDKGVIAVVDEAYYFFHDHTAADILDSYENLIVVRTFSKAFGLAGLRAGYLLSQKENIANISRFKPMHELNSFSILVIDELLNNLGELQSFVEKTALELQYFKDGFNSLGIETSNSTCNFLAVCLGKHIPLQELRENLAELDILIRRPFAEEHLSDWVRIGTAPIPYEEVVLDVVRNALKTSGEVN